MRKSSKILIAATFVGMAVAGGAAFTATGVTNTADPEVFVGGTVSQSVSGASLSNVAYTYADASNTAVVSIDLTFATDDAGRTVTVDATGASAGTFDQVIPVQVNGSGHAVFAYVPDAGETGFAGLESIAINVAE